jgi:hypothetical protein
MRFDRHLSPTYAFMPPNAVAAEDLIFFMTEPSRNGAGLEKHLRQDRRRHPRVRCVIGAACRWETGAETMGLVMDLSRTGARVAFWQGADPPLEGMLQLRTGNGATLERSARSVHTERCGNRWLVGYHFDEPLNDDQLAALIA